MEGTYMAWIYAIAIGLGLLSGAVALVLIFLVRWFFARVDEDIAGIISEISKPD